MKSRYSLNNPPRLYIAYGSNLDKLQMRYRCPTSEFWRSGFLEGWELNFKHVGMCSYATIDRNPHSKVPVGVWKISETDERKLDLYEGWPTHYFKTAVYVRMDDGTQVKGMVYIMNKKAKIGVPSQSYVDTICRGYRDCDLDFDYLQDAVDRCFIG
jgi:hypothetical protein